MTYSSPHYNGNIFLNPVPTEVTKKGAFFRILGDYLKKNPNRKPGKPPGPFLVNIQQYDHLPLNILRLTWLGHSTVLVEIDGRRFLTDPVWSQRASPFSWIGPKRFFDVPVNLKDLPPIDAVLLSHDHYDHMDKDTLIYLAKKGVSFICPLGVGSRLLTWGITAEKLTVLDWHQQATLFDQFTITLTPARHFSGRWLTDRFTTLWSSFVVKGPHHTCYYGADSGLYDGFNDIGKQYGPFDVTMLNIGAYNENWATIHMMPEEAILAHRMLNGQLFMPLHWGTFDLALHGWTEPVERVLAAAKTNHVSLLLPAPGQVWNIDDGAVITPWWIDNVSG